jgi:tRNA pseudouridine55 synthase
MSSLVRTRAGAFTLEEAVDFDAVERAMEAHTMDALLLPTDSLFPDYPAVTLDAYGLSRAEHGAFIAPPHARHMPEAENALCRVYDEAGRFLMLGQVRTLDKGGKAVFVYKNFR